MSDWERWLWFVLGLLLGALFIMALGHFLEGQATCQAHDQAINNTCTVEWWDP